MRIFAGFIKSIRSRKVNPTMAEDLEKDLSVISVRVEMLLREASKYLSRLTPENIVSISSIRYLSKEANTSVIQCFECLNIGDTRRARDFYNKAQSQAEKINEKCDRLTAAIRNVRRVDD